METMMIATNKVKAIMYSISVTPFHRGFGNRPLSYPTSACGKPRKDIISQKQLKIKGFLYMQKVLLFIERKHSREGRGWK